MKEKNIVTDVLVIGGAGAGLRAAIEARAKGVDVTLASKMPAAGSSSTLVAAGWLTCSTQDSEEELFRQIVHAGGYLNNQRLVEILVKGVSQRMPELEQFGVPMQEREGRSPNMPGLYLLPKVPGEPRGYAMVHSMREYAEKAGVTILDNMQISALITLDNAVVGAAGIELNTGEFVTISAKSTVLATGGGAYAFERNNTPAGTTGDGFSLAYWAGAELVDIECVSLNFPRSMLQEIFEVKGEPTFSFLEKGMAHYFLGGVKIDENCSTSVSGLFAAGEVTGGVFGAGRLGGSALADTIVFGARAGQSAALRAKKLDAPALNTAQIDAEREKFEYMSKGRGYSATDTLAKLRYILWWYMGIVKTSDILTKGLKELSKMSDQVSDLRAVNAREIQAAVEARGIMQLGQIIATASLIREETRGNYWRADYPEPDNEKWMKNIVVYKDGDEIKTRLDPVVMTRLSSPTQPPLGEGCFNYFPMQNREKI